MTEPAHDGWVKCPPGELQRLATRLRQRRRRRAVWSAALALLAAAGVGGGIWLAAALASRPPEHQPIPCTAPVCPGSSPAEEPPPGCSHP